MDILTAIRNATGPRPALFVPEVCICEGYQVSSCVMSSYHTQNSSVFMHVHIIRLINENIFFLIVLGII